MVHSQDFEESDGESTQPKIGDSSIKRTSPGSSEWLKELNIEKSELTRDQELRFLAMIRDYEDVFSKNDHRPIKQHPRRMPPHQRPLVEKQVELFLSQ